MTTLNDFLLSNPVSEVSDEVTVSERISDPETKQPYRFKIKGVSGDAYSEYQKQCTKLGKKGKIEFDSARLNELLVINHTVEPNFRDAENISKIGVHTPEQYLKKVLLAGEIVTLAQKISELSGFDKDVDELVEEAKN